jgi:hypothetical protein
MDCWAREMDYAKAVFLEDAVADIPAQLLIGAVPIFPVYLQCHAVGRQVEIGIAGGDLLLLFERNAQCLERLSDLSL